MARNREIKLDTGEDRGGVSAAFEVLQRSLVETNSNPGFFSFTIRRTPHQHNGDEKPSPFAMSSLHQAFLRGALATCNTHLVQPQSRQCGLRMAADGLAFACCLSRHTPGLFQNSRDFLRFPTTTTKYEAKSRQWTPLAVDAVSIRLIKTQQKRVVYKPRLGCHPEDATDSATQILSQKEKSPENCPTKRSEQFQRVTTHSRLKQRVFFYAGILGHNLGPCIPEQTIRNAGSVRTVMALTGRGHRGHRVGVLRR
ncbi:hypothetical protein Bbelb_134850 [Branchiostoma belcheri]|nr:hypothetical protein Bbelb_134850 [Branchiostoma belcheri]